MTKKHSDHLSAPFFSIVIPSLNEERCLPDLLGDLSEQSYRDFEVLHIDGSSEDKTVAIAKKFAKKIPITTEVTATRNVSFQRNRGIRKATGTWIIFMDADNRIPPEFLDGIRYRLAQKPKTDTFTTWVSIDSDKSLNKPIEQTINIGLELGKIVGKEWSFGALIGVKASILSEKFYFDERQKLVEDGLFILKLVESGYTFSVFRDPRYTYSVRRFTTEGTITMARRSARIVLNYIQGKDFAENDFGYKMEGGSVYKEASFFNRSLPTILTSATKKQLKQAQKVLKYLLNLGS